MQQPTQTSIPHYERQRCGYIISKFEKKQITSVSYFDKSFNSLDEFVKEMISKDIDPIIVEEETPFEQPLIQLTNGL